MKVTIDSAGRILIPRSIRDQTGIRAGDPVDVSVHGAGLMIIPNSRTARITVRDGALVAESTTTVDDDVVFGLIDRGRR